MRLGVKTERRQRRRADERLVLDPDEFYILASRAALEVRSRDAPFLLEDGQPVGRLIHEELADTADERYGASATSNHQGQGLKPSKHFRAFGEG